MKALKNIGGLLTKLRSLFIDTTGKYAARAHWQPKRGSNKSTAVILKLVSQSKQMATQNVVAQRR